MLFRPGKNWFNGNEGYSNSVLNKDRLNEDIVFWGADFNVKSENFSGGSIDTVFGGFKLDLREAKLSEGNSTLEVNAVFGGGEVIVPKDMRVEVETSAFMGGVTNQTSNSAASGSTLKIKATAVFGGIEIKN